MNVVKDLVMLKILQFSWSCQPNHTTIATIDIFRSLLSFHPRGTECSAMDVVFFPFVENCSRPSDSECWVCSTLGLQVHELFYWLGRSALDRWKHDIGSVICLITVYKSDLMKLVLMACVMQGQCRLTPFLEMHPRTMLCMSDYVTQRTVLCSVLLTVSPTKQCTHT